MEGKQHKRPALTVDGVLVEDEKILLIKRGNTPYRGMYALPGGFVDYGERVEDAVIREMEEETGLKTGISRLLGVYSDPSRDPRGHTVSVVFVLNFKYGSLSAGDDAAEASWFPLDDLPELAFDHAAIVDDFLRSE